MQFDLVREVEGSRVREGHILLVREYEGEREREWKLFVSKREGEFEGEKVGTH